ncbi:hypothetical protein IWQ60_007796 [Tieghemiomyces parasiticus]|uniref:Cytochrome c oxidase assembly protein COX20, mitochondrial n=1 Tax=Tieghemiomyces parasiticus TaxID=78921 RepID=A0A9W8A4R5_9FUNG|nr:hypothetical protein IWQ60_007796 [Tieghemiomyces parasiticus]
MSTWERYKEAFQRLSWDDLDHVERMPCFRDGFLYGLTGAFVLGGLRFLQKGRVLSACNWTVGGFVVFSIASRQLCLYQRREQLRRMNITFKDSIERRTPHVPPKGRSEDFVPTSELVAAAEEKSSPVAAPPTEEK